MGRGDARWQKIERQDASKKKWGDETRGKKQMGRQDARQKKGRQDTRQNKTT